MEEDDDWGDEGFADDVGGDDDWGDDGGTIGFEDDDTIPSVPYDILDSKQLSQEMSEMLEDLADLTGISKELASMVLRASNWNREKVQGSMMDDEAFLAKLGVKAYEPQTIGGEGEIECRICLDDVPASDSLENPCGHRFCKGCWTDYMENVIQDKGKICILTRCAEVKCGVAVPDSIASTILTPELYSKYQNFILRSFVEDNRHMAWCPAPRCEYAIKTRNLAVLSVACKCGNKFCFRCSEEAHAPSSCQHLAQWLDKCRSESETANWIIANTKKCPKCLVRIEKNSGCNHMTCQACKWEFCWICDGPWSEHGNQTGGFYKCNKYNPKKAKTDDAKSDAEAELGKYLFYYQRYHNHDQSKRFAEKQRKQAMDRMLQFQEAGDSGQSWMESTFLKNAVEQVFECRRVLKYTYVFGYYLPDGREKTLFEYLQQDLEKNTEKLSELSEKPLDQIDRHNVVNYTQITKRFMDNLLEGIANGLVSGEEDFAVTAASSSSSSSAAPTATATTADTSAPSS